MSVFDATAIDLAAKTASPTPSTEAAAAAAPASDKDGDAGKKQEKGVALPPASDTIDELLDKYGLSTKQELDEFLSKSTKVMSRLGDADPDELVRDSETLKKYRKEWAKEERSKAKEGETPEQTIARLEAELDEREYKFSKASRERERAEQAKQNLDGFFGFVSASIDQMKDIEAPLKPVVAAIMGVGNPVNDIDIKDRKAAKRVLTEYAVKVAKTAQEALIKSYRTGKDQIPVVPPPGDSAPATTTVDGQGPKNLTEARRIASQSLTALLRRK